MRVTMTETVGSIKKVLEIIFNDELGVTIEEHKQKLSIDLTPSKVKKKANKLPRR